MITKEQAKRLKAGDYVWLIYRMPYNPMYKIKRLKVNGACRTWATWPPQWTVPYVRGISETGVFGTTVKCVRSGLVPDKMYLSKEEAQYECDMLHIAAMLKDGHDN